MAPKYNLEKIKFSTDEPTFKRAVGLYESGKVTKFEDTDYTYTATVLGTNPYHVFVSYTHFDKGNCECYLGQHETLCKHMVAVAIHAVKKGGALTKADKTQNNELTFSGKAGVLTITELSEFKKSTTSALRYIKPYSGPSRTWFSYQNSLDEGCNRLSALFSELPASSQTSKLIINLLLRLDKKLTFGGVDDSNGTVGGFIQDSVKLLIKFAKVDTECSKEFERLRGKETCFGWEEPLL